jgi:hypothetical protein
MSISSRPLPCLVVCSLIVASGACSGSSVEEPASSQHDDAGGALDGRLDAHGALVDASRDGARTDSGPTSTSEAGKGPHVDVRVVAVQNAIAGGGVAQETPVDQQVGILGLSLLKDVNDPAPFVVIDHTQPIATPYDDGSNTLIGSIAASALQPGTYTIARVPVAYVNFTVAGTYHDGATPIVGDFTDLIALTSGVTLDGAVRDRGWWSSSFAVAGMTEGAVTGETADIAQPGAGSHLGLDLSQTVAAYVFPVSLVIPPDITSDMQVVFTVNTFEDFHWTDETEAGYATGAFDVSPGVFEPVTQLGANSFTVTFGPIP